MAVIKDYYKNTREFMQCTGLSKKELQHIACDYSIELSGVCFNYPKYVVPEKLGNYDCLEFLLYSGYYGSFPIPSTAPSFFSEKEKRMLGLDFESWLDLFDKFLNESCIDSGLDMTMNSFNLSLSNPGLLYEDLYTVVWFLLCLREELIKANYYKRNIRYTSIIEFEGPVYSRKNGYAEPWSNENNVVLACLVSILSAIQQFLSCTFFFNEVDNYNFICNSWSPDDLRRLLPSYNCVTSRKAKRLLCTVLEELLQILEYYECVIKHIPVKKVKESFWNIFSKQSIDDLVKKIFCKISRMEYYVRLI